MSNQAVESVQSIKTHVLYSFFWSMYCIIFIIDLEHREVINSKISVGVCAYEIKKFHKFNKERKEKKTKQNKRI